MSKVLVIDDEQNLLKLAGVNLRARGYQVLTASDGEKGLKLARLEHPDLILLDLMLPGISGWDVLMSLKADRKLRKIPVIILTAAEQQGEENKTRSMKASGYLAKPFGVDQLLWQVQKNLKK